MGGLPPREIVMQSQVELVTMLTKPLRIGNTTEFVQATMSVGVFPKAVVVCREQPNNNPLASEVLMHTYVHLAGDFGDAIHGLEVLTSGRGGIANTCSLWLHTKELGIKRNKRGRAAMSLSYWKAGAEQAEFDGQGICSVTCDATRVGNTNIYTIAILHPSNIGCFLPAQDLGDPRSGGGGVVKRVWFLDSVSLGLRNIRILRKARPIKSMMSCWLIRS